MFKVKSVAFLLQAGDFFHHAQSNATAQQREFEEHRLAEGSMDSPLLLEQVLIFCLALYVRISYYINSIALSLQKKILLQCLITC